MIQHTLNWVAIIKMEKKYFYIEDLIEVKCPPSLKTEEIYELGTKIVKYELEKEYGSDIEIIELDIPNID